MYVRPPNSKNGMKIPENYSGNAFSRSSRLSDMPPPLKVQAVRQDIPPSDIPTENEHEAGAESLYNNDEVFIETSVKDAEEKRAPSAQASDSSIFSSLLPKGNLSSHFPFGHGIGSEELLILAVMLMVFLSGNECGEVDSEFLLMLGLLLFSG